MKLVVCWVVGRRVWQTKLAPKRSEFLRYVAEAEEGVVLIPRVAEVAQVELEVTVRVGIHVRHPTLEVGTRRHKLKYDRLSGVTKNDAGHSLNFTPSLEDLPHSLVYRTDVFVYHRRKRTCVRRIRHTTGLFLLREFDDMKP